MKKDNTPYILPSNGLFNGSRTSDQVVIIEEALSLGIDSLIIK